MKDEFGVDYAMIRNALAFYVHHMLVKKHQYVLNMPGA
jgi:hypothetical protein